MVNPFDQGRMGDFIEKSNKLHIWTKWSRFGLDSDKKTAIWGCNNWDDLTEKHGMRTPDEWQKPQNQSSTPGEIWFAHPYQILFRIKYRDVILNQWTGNQKRGWPVRHSMFEESKYHLFGIAKNASSKSGQRRHWGNLSAMKPNNDPAVLSARRQLKNYLSSTVLWLVDLH